MIVSGIDLCNNGYIYKFVEVFGFVGLVYKYDIYRNISGNDGIVYFYNIKSNIVYYS